MARPRELSLDELAEVLEGHQEWIKSRGKKGKKANLSHADLQKADLSGANLYRADLVEANLQGAVLFKANLQQANLSRANLLGAVLLKASLQGANLSNANLQGSVLLKADLQEANLTSAKLRKADLSGADLKGAVLIEANLREAHLTKAILREANLQDTDFSDATGLLDSQLAGTNLSGARLPDSIAKFEGLKQVEETSRNARKIFFIVLLGCAYSWLTIATTTDARLVTDSPSSPLPIIHTEIPIATFYWVAPVMLLTLYFYLHLYLQRLWQGLSRLPAVFPDGRALDERAYPWLLNGLTRSYLKQLKDHRPSLSRLEIFFSTVLAWWIVPATLLLFWLRYLPRHDWMGTALHIGLIVIASAFWVLSRHLTKKTLRLEERPRYTWKRALGDARTYQGAMLATGIFGLGIIFYNLSLGAIDGIPDRFLSPTYTVSIPMPLKLTLVLKFPNNGLSDVQRWVPRAIELIHHSPFANLTEEDVSLKPPNWTGRHEEIPLVKGALLKGRDLRFTNAARAFLVKADLREADLTGANLAQADLRKANLEGADLNRADLRGAILTGVVGLRQEQINRACVDEKTRLPLSLERPERPTC
ncbi:MAG: pentapeptide repeat-containing protein [Candidatus Binatia bacterium]